MSVIPIAFNVYLIVWPTACQVKDEGPQLKDKGRDTVLPGQGCRMPQGAEIDKYGAMVEEIQRETSSGATVSTMKSPGTEPEAPWLEAGT
jgi:hypothetical protein